MPRPAPGPFGKVDAAALEALRAACGPAYVITSVEDRERYGSDETEDLWFDPEVVVRPRTTAEVAAVMRVAHERRLPVTPRAGGTGLSGGALPVRGGIVLSVERMDSILEIDRANLVAVVEPGVITQRLQEAVEKVGLYYPPDPASRGSCTLGGNVAENAGGPHAAKYGVTKDFVLGLEAVLPDGGVVRPGGKLLKNRTGYSLAQLLVGSEGTLAVVTRIWLKLIPRPAFRRTSIRERRSNSRSIPTTGRRSPSTPTARATKSGRGNLNSPATSAGRTRTEPSRRRRRSTSNPARGR